MADIDLDARRKLLKAKTVRANGHTYTMPVYLPATILQVGFALAKARTEPDEAMAAVRLAYASVFGEKNVDQAMADISLNEFQALTEEAYRVSPGESPASPAPSRRTGTRPKRTSNGSTDSI